MKSESGFSLAMASQPLTNMMCVHVSKLCLGHKSDRAGGKDNSQADNEWTGSKCGIWGQGNTVERRRDDLEGA